MPSSQGALGHAVNRAKTPPAVGVKSTSGRRFNRGGHTTTAAATHGGPENNTPAEIGANRLASPPFQALVPEMEAICGGGLISRMPLPERRNPALGRDFARSG
jgi:hypothetical protein